MSERSPSMVVMKEAYGENFPVMWLMEQILELVVYSNSKGTLNDYQAEYLANTIVNEYYFLKASELMLFFYQLKSGKYGHFYGIIDPMRIMEALGDFKDERDRVLSRHEMEEEKRMAAMEPKLPTIKPEDWCREVGLPECHSATEAWQMGNRILNIVDGILWAIDLFHKTVCAS